jgi:hypothetical protein
MNEATMNVTEIDAIQTAVTVIAFYRKITSTNE